MNCDRVFVVLTRGPFPTGDPSDEAVEGHLARCPDCRRLAEALRPVARVKDEFGLRSTDIVGRTVEEIFGFEERRRLPGYWGDASSEAADEILARFSSASQAGVELEPAAVTCSPQDAEHHDAKRGAGGFLSTRLSRLWRFVLAGVIGVSLGGALHFWWLASEPPLWGGAGHRVQSVHAAQQEQEPAAADNPRLLATSHQLLATQRLPAACTAPPPQSPEQRKASDGRVKHSLASFASPTEHQACCTQCHHAGAGKDIPIAAASAVRNNCKFCHGDMPRTAADTW